MASEDASKFVQVQRGRHLKTPLRSCRCSEAELSLVQERLRGGLLEIFPDLSETKLSHHWFGFVAFPMDELPKLTIHNGVVYATGFCGSGVVWARWMGQKAAMVVMGREEGASAFDKVPFRAIPFYNGTPWFLPVMMNWYKLKDRMTGTLK